jgi:hypothetical protein
LFFPAISKAVRDQEKFLTNGNPAEKFTPSPAAMVLKGICPCHDTLPVPHRTAGNSSCKKCISTKRTKTNLSFLASLMAGLIMIFLFFSQSDLHHLHAGSNPVRQSRFIISKISA